MFSVSWFSISTSMHHACERVANWNKSLVHCDIATDVNNRRVVQACTLRVSANGKRYSTRSPCFAGGGTAVIKNIPK